MNVAGIGIDENFGSDSSQSLQLEDSIYSSDFEEGLEKEESGEKESEGEYIDESVTDDQQEEPEGNWWDSPPESDYATFSLEVENYCFHTPILTGRAVSFSCIFPLRMIGRSKRLDCEEIRLQNIKNTLKIPETYMVSTLKTSCSYAIVESIAM